jgi:predicted transcriptional regulator
MTSCGCLSCGEQNAIGYAKHYSRSHDAVIRVYDEAGKVIKTHEDSGDFRES